MVEDSARFAREVGRGEVLTDRADPGAALLDVLADDGRRAAALGRAGQAELRVLLSRKAPP